MKHPDAIPVRITGWDRAAIVALGAAGCALSYDALQQMAVAIHIRGLLTYLFPFVVDGFIGYGVRAVLVMRAASLGARCYVWALFGTATAASIWANALHAVRLNDQSSGGGLRLGNATVGVLSTLAPLSLAGAVHLYILIARRAAQPGHSDTVVTAAVRTERVTAGGPDTPDGQDTARPVTGYRLSELSASDADHPVGPRDVGPDLAPEDVPEHEGEHPGRGGERDARSGHFFPSRSPGQDPPGPDETADTVSGDADELLPIARHAVTDAGKLTRKVVADAIRGQGQPLSNDRLTELMQKLRAEADNRTLRLTS